MIQGQSIFGSNAKDVKMKASSEFHLPFRTSFLQFPSECNLSPFRMFPVEKSSRVRIVNGKSECFSVWRCLLVNDVKSSLSRSCEQHTIEYPRLPIALKNSCAVLLCHGGFFAGGLFSLVTDKFGRRIERCHTHKTFHQYVVRKKSGQRQANRDSRAGQHTKSIGSSMRRENEKKHREKIVETITSWAEELKKVDLIFYHSPGLNKRILFPPQSSSSSKIINGKVVPYPLSIDDVRVNKIPFTTRKATFEEVKLTYERISSVVIYDEDCPHSNSDSDGNGNSNSSDNDDNEVENDEIFDTSEDPPDDREEDIE